MTASSQQLAHQFNLASQICDGMNQSNDALEEVRSLRAQWRTLAGQAPKGPLPDVIAALDQKAVPFEGSACRLGPQPQQESFSK